MNIRNILLGGLLASFTMASCTKEEALIIEPAKTIGGPELLSPSSGAYILDQDNAKGSFETFIWSAAYFGDDNAPSYTLQMDLPTGDFSAPLALKSTQGLYSSITVAEMNQKLRDFGIAGEEITPLQIRVLAESNGELMASPTAAISVNRYLFQDEIPLWHVSGDAIGEEMLEMTANDDATIWSIRGNFTAGTFKFIDSSIHATIYGMGATEETLAEDGAAIQIAEDGNYSIEINLLDKSYTVVQNLLPQNLYFVGSVNGWNGAEPFHAKVKDEDNGLHWGVLNIGDSDEVKIMQTINDWDTAFAQGAEAGTLVANNGGGNIILADLPGYEGPAQYLVLIDVAQLNISLVKIDKIAIVGDGANEGWPNDDEGSNLGVTLDFDETSATWTAQDVAFNASGSWKFRFNDSWTYNMGGDMDDLTWDGANFTSPGESKTVVLDLISAKPFSFTLE